MQCREARRALAGERPEALEAARAHVAGCAECQARADQLAGAILSGEDEELSCAECRARQDEQAASALAEGTPLVAAAWDALVARHLEGCPECEESWSLLAEGLAALAEDRLPQPESWPSLDLSFALDRPEEAAEEERAETWLNRMRARMRDLGSSGWLAGFGRSLDSPMWQGASRVALASLALVSAIGLAWLLIFDPVLPEPIRSISPFDEASATPDAADRAATQTMAVQMGLDWVESAEELAATQTMAVQMGTDWVEGAGVGPTPTVASGRAGPTAPTSTATRSPGAGDGREPGGRRRQPSPTPDGPTQMITGTLRTKPIIPYPPPPSPTDDPYPGPEASPVPASPEPDDPEATPTASEPMPSATPVPSATREPRP